MNVLMYYAFFNDFYYNRYREQLHAIADNVDELHIVVKIGSLVTPIHDNIIIHYERIKKHQTRSNRDHASKMIAKKYTGYRYLNLIRTAYKRARRTSVLPIDLVFGYSGTGYNQLYHTLVGQRMKIPVIHRMRGYGRYERKLKCRPITRFYNDFLEDASYLMYDYHIPINQNMKNILSMKGIPEYKISNPIGLGVDTETFNPTNIERKYVGYLGRISPEKGIHTVIQLAKRTPEINYLVVGGGQRLTYPSNVKYVGNVLKPKMNQYYNQCRCVLMPSLMEGISNTVLECYATGTPLIASPYAVDPSLPMYGLKVPLRLESWVKVVKNLDLLDLTKTGEESRKWAKQNTWHAFGKRLGKEFRKVVENYE